MKKLGLEIIVHLLFWLSTAWLITSGFSIQAQEIELVDGIETVHIVRNRDWVLQLVTCIVASCIAFYGNAGLIITANRNKRGRKSILGSISIFGILVFLTYVLTEYTIFDDSLPIPREIAFGIAIFYFAISIAYGLVKSSIFNERRQQQLIVDKDRAELSLLRNQLQPHFLFNALNNLLSMVHPTDNPKLMDSIERLSQLLRFVIEGSKAEKISMEKEITFLENYIELQMLRFNEGEVDVAFHITGDHRRQVVESGLFIPFVENAFKYGTEPENRARIEIHFDLSQAHTVGFTIKNKVLLHNPNGIGTGIAVTQKRLGLMYPDKHELTLSKTGDFIVQLTIQTQ
ncbi:sensor histidine kinase [Maribacter polysaccharolyticus]|uniref:sensor histidine kinase n=1 Tax=Maribacter polysaccharolyticus TaxID=3020831 RepID=UPI00237EFAFC|nr:sensor histidine kinase [Maribacter polysaccharolyticus]MDE3741280.1 histidine kinase [Maribacter polysaccharolyticus]